MHSISDLVVRAADSLHLYYISLFVLSYYIQVNLQTTDINNVKQSSVAMMPPIPRNAALRHCMSSLLSKAMRNLLNTGHLKLLQSLLAIMLTSSACQAYTAWWKNTQVCHLTTAHTTRLNLSGKLPVWYLTTQIWMVWTPNVKHIKTSRQCWDCGWKDEQRMVLSLFR